MDISTEQFEILHHWVKRNEKNTESFLHIGSQEAQPKSNRERASDKSRFKDILRNNWPVIFKSVKVTKDKESLRVTF